MKENQSTYPTKRLDEIFTEAQIKELHDLWSRKCDLSHEQKCMYFCLLHSEYLKKKNIFPQYMGYALYITLSRAVG